MAGGLFGGMLTPKRELLVFFVEFLVRYATGKLMERLRAIKNHRRQQVPAISGDTATRIVYSVGVVF